MKTIVSFIGGYWIGKHLSGWLFRKCLQKAYPNDWTIILDDTVFGAYELSYDVWDNKIKPIFDELVS